MIDRVIVINLPFRTDRRALQCGHLETIGVPQDAVEFYPAIYGKDYESVRAVQEAADADGFHGLGRDLGNSPEEQNVYAYNWTYSKIMRSIMESSSCAVIMIDDMMLSVTFDQLVASVEDIHRNAAPFYMLQIGWKTLWSNEYPKREYVSGMVARGIKGHGEYAMVYNAEGAEIMLNLIDKHPMFYIERLLYNLSFPDQSTTGLFHFIDSKADVVDLDWEQNLVERD